MSIPSWICSQCLRRLSRPAISQARFQTRVQSRTQSTTTTLLSTPSPHTLAPPLLLRARSLAAEHERLTTELATAFSATSAKRLGELSPTSTALAAYDHAQSTLTELLPLLSSSDAELRTLAAEDLDPTHHRLSLAASALKATLIPAHPFAHLPCLLEIRPGAGGDEAALFAGDLLRMYQSYCAAHSLPFSLLKLDSSEAASSSASSSSGGGGLGSVSEAVLEIPSPGAYGMLRCEAGVHRVQRVPATESKGRTHTSAASVLVLPAMEEGGGGGEESWEDPKSDYYVDPKEVRTDVLRASGAGGQHVNKTESAVRLSHEKTGTVVFIQETRSQVKNKERAWRLLRARIAGLRREEREEEMVRLRRGAGAGKVGRGDKVRTYNWGQQRVTDHRSGFTSRVLDRVLEGGEGLEEVMESVRAWMAEQEVLGLVAEEEEEGKKGG